jgi:hypothetical protein
MTSNDGRRIIGDSQIPKSDFERSHNPKPGTTVQPKVPALPSTQAPPPPPPSKND